MHYKTSKYGETASAISHIVSDYPKTDLRDIPHCIRLPEDRQKRYFSVSDYLKTDITDISYCIRLPEDISHCIRLPEDRQKRYFTVYQTT